MEETIVGQAVDQARALEFLMSVDWWYGIAVGLINVIMILVLARVALHVVRRSIRSANKRATANLAAHDPQLKRRNTLSSLATSVVTYVVWGVALIMVLSELDVEIGPLLAGAGVLGLALGFGAQELVRDVVSGVFLLMDDSLAVGDTISVNGHTAKVESMSMRSVRARKFDGELMMIPAGEIRIFGNRSKDYSRAVVEVGASYDARPSEVKAALQLAADQTIESKRDLVLEDRGRSSILGFGDSAVNYEVMVKCIPGEHRSVRRVLYERVLENFADAGIEIPYPNRTVTLKGDLPAASAG